MAERAKKITMTTPRGVFVYPKLNEPDLGTKQYPKDPPGEFSVKLRLVAANPATQAFLKKLAPYHKAAIEAGQEKYAALDKQTRVRLEKQGGFKVNDLYTEIFDKETEQATGEIEIKFSMKAGGTIKKGPKAGKVWIARPVVVDAKGKPIVMFTGKDQEPRKGAPAIWGGTTGIISFEFEEGGYFISGTGAAGLSLRLVGAQLIDLVSGGQRTAASMGFTAQEDGFEYSGDAPSDDADDTAEEDEFASNEGAKGDAPEADEDF